MPKNVSMKIFGLVALVWALSGAPLAVSFSHNFLILPRRDGKDFLSLCANSAAEDSEKLLEGLRDAQDSLLFVDLQSRIEQLKSGIGKRYQTRTQRGFLNVHNDTSCPFATHNILGQLVEGEVVTSIAPKEGDWIKHSGGGWSISKFGGWQWLVPLED